MINANTCPDITIMNTGDKSLESQVLLYTGSEVVDLAKLKMPKQLTK